MIVNKFFFYSFTFLNEHKHKNNIAYPNSEKEFEIGGILIGLLQALQFNAHEIYETKAFEGQKNVGGGKNLMYIGAALYNSAAYFNHSCYPDVIRYFVGTTIVLCTSHPIQIGDGISENYGPVFTKQTVAIRQRNLQSRYWFKCACTACKENWPSLDKLNNKARLRFEILIFHLHIYRNWVKLPLFQYSFYRCSNTMCKHLFNYPEKAKKSVKCPQCKEQTNLEVQIAALKRAENLYRTAAEHMDRDQLRDAAKEFIEGINLFYSVATPPHRDTTIAQESLRVCLSNIGHI